MFTTLTTVHKRNDSRIFIKQVQTLHHAFSEDISLIVADGQGDDRRERLTIHDLGKSRSRLGRALIGSARAFRAVLRVRPRIVHFHDPELIPLGLILKALGFKVIYDVHEDLPLQIMGKEWIPRYLRRAVAAAMRVLEFLAGSAFDAVVPATPSISIRFPAKKAVVVQNFPIRSELLVSKPMPYESRPLDFSYVGGLTEIRGAFEMLRALDHLQRDDVRLNIAGQFAPPALATRLRESRGWKHVVYHGTLDRPRVADLMAQARAGLVLFHPLPNHLDAQPTKLFEYMAAGLPVIASNFRLWREIVEGARCGLLVDPLKPEAIAHAMKWILDNPSEAEQMGRRGQEAVNQTYNWDREAEKLIALYQRLGAVDLVEA